MRLYDTAHCLVLDSVRRDVANGLQQAMRAIETVKRFGILGDAQWTNRHHLLDARMPDLIEHFSTLELTVANLPGEELG